MRSPGTDKAETISTEQSQVIVQQSFEDLNVSLMGYDVPPAACQHDLCIFSLVARMPDYPRLGDPTFTNCLPSWYVNGVNAAGILVHHLRWRSS